MDLRIIASRLVEITNRYLSATVYGMKWKQMVDVAFDEHVGNDTYHIRLYGLVKGKDYDVDMGMYQRFELQEYSCTMSAMIDGNFYFGDELNMLFRDEQEEFGASIDSSRS